MDTLAENIRLAQEFTAEAFPHYKRHDLEARLSHLAGPHALCWAQPGYRDGAVSEGYRFESIA
jgi:hypothetical protein